MKTVLMGVIPALLCCGLYAVNNGAVPDNSPGRGKAEVIIIGTLHGGHYKNEQYSPRALRDIILSLIPDAILNELPLSKVDPNGRPVYREHDKHCEGWASYTAAKQLGVRQIPFDRPDRDENYRRTNYFDRQEEANKLSNRWADEQSQKDPNCIDLKILKILIDASYAQGYLDIHGSPRNINSEGYDRIIRIKHSVGKEIMPEILKKYPEYEILGTESKFFRDQWKQRNKIMAENIVRIADEYRGKRLVVLTGSEHRYILQDLLKNEQSIELKEYWQVNSKCEAGD